MPISLVESSEKNSEDNVFLWFGTDMRFPLRVAHREHEICISSQGRRRMARWCLCMSRLVGQTTHLEPYFVWHVLRHRGAHYAYVNALHPSIYDVYA